MNKYLASSIIFGSAAVISAAIVLPSVLSKQDQLPASLPQDLVVEVVLRQGESLERIGSMISTVGGKYGTLQNVSSNSSDTYIAFEVVSEWGLESGAEMVSDEERARDMLAAFPDVYAAEIVSAPGMNTESPLQ